MEKLMKKLLLTTLMVTALASPIAYAGHPEMNHATKHEAAVTVGKTIVAHVEGMVCDFCARGLEKTFGKKDEVKNLIVSLEQGTVTLHMNPNQDLSDEDIIEIIKGNGINTTSIDRGKDNESHDGHDHSKEHGGHH